MALIKRQPRKTMKVIDAANRLETSRTTVKRLIAAGDLIKVHRPGRGPTSPILLYASHVEKLAQEWGL